MITKLLKKWAASIVAKNFSVEEKRNLLCKEDKIFLAKISLKNFDLVNKLYQAIDRIEKQVIKNDKNHASLRLCVAKIISEVVNNNDEFDILAAMAYFIDKKIPLEIATLDLEPEERFQKIIDRLQSDVIGVEPEYNKISKGNEGELNKGSKYDYENVMQDKRFRLYALEIIFTDNLKYLIDEVATLENLDELFLVYSKSKNEKPIYFDIMAVDGINKKVYWYYITDEGEIPFKPELVKRQNKSKG